MEVKTKSYFIFFFKEKAFLENADHIISLTFAGKKEIESWKYVDKNPLPISIIPCCLDMALFEPTRIRPEDIEYRESQERFGNKSK